MTIRVSGVYDLRTIKRLQEKKVSHFAFDFRPRSLNFIQEHLCLDILKSSSLGSLYLQFENEKSYVIDRVFSNIRSSFEGNVALELFNCDDSTEEVKHPFIVNIDSENLPGWIFKSPYLKGYSIDSQFLCRLKDSGRFDPWLRSFYSLNSGNSNNLLHILCRDWDDDIFPSLYELLDFDLVSLPINPKVESCFRNVDLKKLTSQLQFISI